MPLIQDSGDVLKIIIALAVLAFTFFACWAIYYLIMILRQSSKIVKEMRDRLNKIDGVIKSLKEKIEHSTSYLMLIGEGIKKVVELLTDRNDKKKAKKKKE